MRRVLVVDDEQSMCDLMVEELVARGMDVRTSTRADDAFTLIGEVDAVVTDLNMRGMSGLDLCERIVANRPDVPVIVITAFGSMDIAIATLRAGAFDFLNKPFEMEQLSLSVERALRHRELRDEVKRLRDAVAGPWRLEDVIGASLVMREVFTLVDRIAGFDPTVLVTGESGTGKELIARAIHARSTRRAGPFVAINCAAVPEGLFESELFGHVRGAYTDARSDRKGLLLEASGGTLFLDEIGETPLSTQVKLLRALEERRIRPVGGTTETPFDARIVTATNRDLQTEVEEGRFREDLFYRINVVEIAMPPLRSRGTDVLLLAQFFLTKFSRDKPVRRLSASVAERLLSYAWPGNVRELRNCLERAVALAQHEELIVEDLPPHIRNYSRSHVIVAADDPSQLVSLAIVEQRYIERVLEAAGGNKRQAARILGLDRATLYRKLSRYTPVPDKP